MNTRCSSIRAVFLDVGFTLLRPYPSLPHICHQVCAEQGWEADPAQFAGAIAQVTDSDHLLSAYQHIWEQDSAIRAMWIRYYQRVLAHAIATNDQEVLSALAGFIYQARELPMAWQVYTDVFPLLDHLKHKGYILGIVSNWGISLGSILHYHHLTPYFDCLISSAIARCAKPSPAIFETALHRVSCQAKEAIYIGDNYISDVLGARAATITPILLDRTQTLAANAFDCLIVHSLVDLLPLLH